MQFSSLKWKRKRDLFLEVAFNLSGSLAFPVCLDPREPNVSVLIFLQEKIQWTVAGGT